MRWAEVLGYLGSVLMFSTFYMKTMIPLRVVGIGANVCMIVYTAISGIHPVLVLQACLLPLNIYRLVQMQRLVERVRKASRGDFSVAALIPFMKLERHARGAKLFKVGDAADRMYVVQSGLLRIVGHGVDRSLGPGELLGEIGMLSPTGLRTASATIEEDAELYTITQQQVLQLYFQNPEFGFFLVRLVTQRLLANLSDVSFDAMATLNASPAGTGSSR
jgi:CRP/FNR family transcriptional regulator, cyclic AMP receptor protein